MWKIKTLNMFAFAYLYIEVCQANGVTFEGEVYWLASTAYSFHESREICQMDGDGEGDLAILDTDDKFMIFKNNFMVSGTYYWLGIKDFQPGVTRGYDMDWRWIDNKLVETMHWDSGQPNGQTASDKQDCVEIKGASTFKWHDRECSDLRTPVCSKPAIPKSVLQASYRRIATNQKMVTLLLEEALVSNLSECAQLCLQWKKFCDYFNVKKEQFVSHCEIVNLYEDYTIDSIDGWNYYEIKY